MRRQRCACALSECGAVGSWGRGAVVAVVVAHWCKTWRAPCATALTRQRDTVLRQRIAVTHPELTHSEAMVVVC